MECSRKPEKKKSMSHPVAIISPFATKWGQVRNGDEYLVTSEEVQWKRLFAGLGRAARIEDPSEADVVGVTSLIARVDLIKVFNWRAWEAPYPEESELLEFSYDDCVKHITRIVRVNRTQEGVLWGAIKSGMFVQLCATAHRKSIGGGQSNAGN